MKSPLVSVVMSVHNGASFLSASIESILGQTMENFEFIIIDDGSTDATAEILKSYTLQDPRIRSYGQSNEGLVSALRRGCEQARGILIARMDADDVAVRDRLEVQAAFLQAHPQVVVLGGAVEFIDTHDKTLAIARNPSRNAEIQRQLLDRNVVWHPTVMMRRAVYKKTDGFRHITDAEDYDLWLCMAESGEIANLRRVLLRYRIHPGQVSVSRCRSQALGALVAQLSASERRAGRLDPFSPRVISPLSLLDRYDVPETRRHTAIARGYLSCVRTMYLSSDYRTALDLLSSLHSDECRSAASWVLADGYLCKARVYWRLGNVRESLYAIIAALRTRPALPARAFKILGGLATWFYERALRWCSPSRTSEADL